ncbi:hypothetical protein Tco_1549051 [Tanacetum coccineum]
METCEPVDTPMVEKYKLDEDLQGNTIDPTRCRGMIGTLMYLTSSRLDLVFAVCMCARYQAKPTEKHLLQMLIMLVAKIPEEVHILGELSWSSKHIDIRYHFIKEQVENRVVELYFIRTDYQLANIFTKALGRERRAFLIDKLRMKSMSPETLKRLA